ncbi:MAG: SRPBCC family protein [Alphaproteobacteria bacterium]|nr:SRPBCC family protein [Alphaproteobacteria bacterium]MCB9791636.1 SRPBCC family protein [Alphaproteobacteria bacterium]
MKAHHELEMNVSPERLMSVITDFEAYPSFIDTLRSAQVRAREERSWEVAFVAHIIRDLPYTLRLTQHGPDPEGVLELRWSLIEGIFKGNSGRWRLTPLDGGARCHARYELDVQAGVHVPRTIVNTLVTRSLPALLEAFRTRAESQALPAK